MTDSTPSAGLPLRIVVELSSNDKDPPKLELLTREPADNALTLTIRYRRHAGDRAPVERPFPWTRKIVDALAALQGHTTDPGAAVFLGDELRKLLEEPGFEEDRRAIERALAEGRRADLVFRLKAQELLALPWELLPLTGDTGTPLGQLPRCLIQYEVHGTTTRRPPSPPPEGGDILFAWAGDERAGPVPVTDHLESIQAACAAGGHPFDPRPGHGVLENASPASLLAAMKERSPAVLHLLCHGVPLGQGRAYGLSLRSEDGVRAAPVTPDQIRGILAPFASSLRLVVVCACFGGATGALDSILGSVAQAIHEAGVQAVIASRLPLSREGSVVLATTLHRALLVDTASLQDAFCAARQALFDRDPTSYDWASLQLFAREADGADLRPFVFRPFRGLFPFDEAHARYFVGREAESDEATREILALVRGSGPDSGPGAPRLYAVMGGSGRGKSSFLAAGVLPRLKQALSTEGEANQPVVPSAALRPSDGLSALRRAIARARRDQLTVLLVDQLEEVFTSLSEAERKPYVTELWQAATRTDKRILVLTGLRIDYLSRFGAFPLPGGLTMEHILCAESHRVVLGPLRTIARVITEPARKVGLTLEEGLCEKIIEDAGDEPGTLPLVQYVLHELWERRSGGKLTMRAYLELGGVKAALPKQATRLLREELTLTESHVARRIFVRLVALSEGAAQGTRCVVKLSELSRGFAKDEGFEAVLNKLAARWLIVVRNADEPGREHSAADSLVEIAHEALIRQWDELGTWVKSYQTVRQELSPYQKMAQSKGGILVGDGIRLLKEIIERHRDDIDASVHALLDKSERAAREEEKKLIGHHRRVLAVAVLASAWAVATSVLGASVWREKRAVLGMQDQLTREKDRASAAAQRAERESRVAGARALVARGQAVWASKLLLSVGPGEETPGWVEVAGEILEQRLPLRTLRGRAATFSADGAWIATIDGASEAVLVQRTDGAGAPLRLEGPTGALTGLAWSRDGGHIAATSGDGTVSLWTGLKDAGRPLQLTLPAPEGPDAPDTLAAEQPVFSADGRYLTALVAGSARVWTSEGVEVTGPLRPGGARVRSVTPSPDGRYLLLATVRGVIEVWTLDPALPCAAARTTERPCRVATLERQGFGAGFRPDGWGLWATRFEPIEEGLLEVLDDQEDAHLEGFLLRPARVQTWSLGQWASPRTALDVADPEANLVSWIDAVAWVDGEQWAFLEQDLTATPQVAIGRGPGRVTLRIPGGAPLAVAPGGARIAVTRGPTVAITETEPLSPRVVLRGGSAAIDGVEIDRTGKSVVTSSGDENTSRLFDLEVGTSGLTLAHDADTHPTEPVSVSVGPGMRRAIVDWGKDGIFSWDLTATRPAKPITGRSAVLSSDGAFVVTLDAGLALIHDAGAPGAPRIITASEGRGDCAVVTAAFGEKEDLLFACLSGSLWETEVSSPVPPRRVGAVSDCPASRTPLLAPRGRTALFFCGDDDVRVVGAAAERHLAPLCTAGAAWALSADGRRAACAAGADLVIHDLAVAGDSRVWQGVAAEISAVGFSRDGERLWVSAADNTVRVLSSDAPAEPLLVAPHPQAVVTGTFDASGRVFATTSQDGWVRVWDLRKNDVPLLFRGEHAEGDGAPRAALSDDGEELLVASWGGAVRRYSLAPTALRARLGASNSDCLPADLRRTYLAETEAEAEDAVATCEHRHGR